MKLRIAHLFVLIAILFGAIYTAVEVYTTEFGHDDDHLHITDMGHDDNHLHAGDAVHDDRHPHVGDTVCISGLGGSNELGIPPVDFVICGELSMSEGYNQ